MVFCDLIFFLDELKIQSKIGENTFVRIGCDMHFDCTQTIAWLEYEFKSYSVSIIFRINHL